MIKSKIRGPEIEVKIFMPLSRIPKPTSYKLPQKLIALLCFLKKGRRETKIQMSLQKYWLTFLIFICLVITLFQGTWKLDHIRGVIQMPEKLVIALKTIYLSCLHSSFYYLICHRYLSRNVEVLVQNLVIQIPEKSVIAFDMIYFLDSVLHHSINLKFVSALCQRIVEGLGRNSVIKIPEKPGTA